jgi:hypothetical protein
MTLLFKNFPRVFADLPPTPSLSDSLLSFRRESGGALALRRRAGGQRERRGALRGREAFAMPQRPGPLQRFQAPKIGLQTTNFNLNGNGFI